MYEKQQTSTIEEAKLEIDSTLFLMNLCRRGLGISFNDSTSLHTFMIQKLIFFLSAFTICYHTFSDIVYIGILLAESPEIFNVVPFFHTFGYGMMSVVKLYAFWYKRHVFGKLLEELADIWPTVPLDPESKAIKDYSIKRLRTRHIWYFVMSLGGVAFFDLTPVVLYIFDSWRGKNADLGYIWASWYPFDKYQPVAHIIVYCFEAFVGITCVLITQSSDLLFTAMASHIGMLLRILQLRLRTPIIKEGMDSSQYIRENIKLHQRIIRFCSHIEDAFSLVNFNNVVFSSVNICCVVFVVVLMEDLLVFSNKLFLFATLFQIGVMCWYADDIYHAVWCWSYVYSVGILYGRIMNPAIVSDHTIRMG